MKKPWFIIGLSAATAILLGIAAWKGVALYSHEPIRPAPAAHMIYDCTGRPLRINLGPGDMDCRPVALSRCHPYFRQALTAVEDRRFFRHCGIDMLAIMRAMLINLLRGRIVSGASTLTTQLVKLNHPRPRTWQTKACEAIEALSLERQMQKNEILEHYINRVPLGGNCVGVESAALRYFDKHADQLSLAEAALLAGLPCAPSRLRPDRHRAQARKRMIHVLERMCTNGFISDARRKNAAAAVLQVKPGRYPFAAPHFCEYVMQRHPALGDLHTTLDGDLQIQVERVCAMHMQTLAAKDIHGVAAVVLAVSNGAVRAMVGSPDYGNRLYAGQVNAADARRSPGSTLKPFIYALAMDRGMIMPMTMLSDQPCRMRAYEPANFDDAFRGAVSVRQALRMSLNIPAVQLTRRLGSRHALRMLYSMGLCTLDLNGDYGLGWILGGCEVKLIELCVAYACLAAGGRTVYPRTLQQGEAVAASHRVLSPETAYIISDMMMEGYTSLYASGYGHHADLPRLAWKTGTSSGFRDAWTVAYNPEFVVGVWVGNPDGHAAADLIGYHVAAPVVGDIFRILYPEGRAPWFKKPADVQQRAVCVCSGKCAGPACDHTVTELYIPGISRNQCCTECSNAGHRRHTEFKYEKTNHEEALRIITPAEGEVFVSRDNDGLPAVLTCQVNRRHEHTPLHWFINGRPVSGNHSSSLHWPLQPGSWTITCCTENGRRASVSISVE